MTESIQQRLMRVRAPRVRITYEVETGGAIEKLELPFIVGILADLKGDAIEGGEPPALKERRLAGIDRDNFDDVLRAFAPGVKLDLSPDPLKAHKKNDSPLDTFLHITSLADFDPLNIVNALPTLRDMYRARNQVRWLQSKAEISDKVADILQGWLHFDASKDTDGSKAFRDQAAALFGGEPLAEANKIALNAPLLNLFANLQALRLAKDAQSSATDAAAAATNVKTAHDAAIATLAAWSLVPATGVNEETLLGWGDLLAGALALPDTPENQVIAKGLVKLLSEEVSEADAKSTDPTLVARRKSRADALAQLGLEADVAKTLATALKAGLEDANTAVNETALAKALLLAGLRAPNSRTGVTDPGALEIEAVRRKFVKDSMAAEGRGMFLTVAHFLHAPTDASKVIARELLGAIKLLGPNDVVSVPAIVHRLKLFVDEIFTQWHAEDPKLLAAKPRGIAAVIDQRVVQIDSALSAALSSIMHSATFRRLEASWRGLHYLVTRSETGTSLKIRVLSATKDELRKDMESAVKFDQSVLFKHIYEAEYGTYGGIPYSLLVGDYSIGGGNDDIEFARKMAEIAAAAHAPFIAAASPSLFGLNDYSELASPRDLSMLFGHVEMEPWHAFREMEDSRYVTLVLPRVLLRLPYGKPEKRNTIQCGGLNFEEQVGAALPTPNADGSFGTFPTPVTDNFLWGNAAYVLAQRITNAFSLYGWTAAIRGVEGGGLVEDLPAYSYASDSGTVELFCPTEVTITDRREKELSDLGFMSLCHCKGTSTAAFFGGQTANSPKRYFSSSADANAKLSSMLPYMLVASRFAHYIKVIMRKKIGTFMTRGNVESYLNNWIANYVLLDDNAPQDAKAAFPLRAANVVVTEVAGSPGSYNATVFLKPHFQLEELSTSIRLVANLPG